MKKFIFHFILYIGCLAAYFNPALCRAENISVDSTPNTLSTPLPPKKYSRTKKFTNEILTFFAIPFVVDKLYPDGAINTNITPALQYFYPTTSLETLESLSKYIKFMVSVKRRYTYVVNTLEQRVKASGIIPTDAPIVAENGEFAPAYSEARKQTSPDKYQVDYTPYKYVEYDSGDLGEPVRQRDKNYAGRITNEDEIVLAILKFDIPGFVKALRKLPRQTDGSDEASVINEHGVASRILLALSSPGENEKIRGVIQLNIPKNYYINADYLNPRARPQFFLSEDTDNNLNIKEYQLYLPEANGVVKDGIAKRILTGTVRYPIEFTRADIEKPMKIKGSFGFEMCHKDGDCQLITDAHELTLNPSIDEELSIYHNYVTQGFTHLPPEKSAHAELKSAQYSAETNELTLTFSTTRTFSNVAAMVEDSQGTNYLNPRYTISDNEITATFTASPSTVQSPLIAVTASFDNNSENLRTTTTLNLPSPESSSPATSPNTAHTVLSNGAPLATQPKLPLHLALALGLILPLAPGIFYLFIRLTQLLWTRPDRLRIFFRYSLGTALGLTLLAAIFHGSYWSLMYENAPLTALSGLLVSSMLAECTNHMDFAIFRPLRGKLRRGFLIGIFSVMLITAFPIPLSAPVFSVAFATQPQNCLLILSLVWLGMHFFPLIALLRRPNAPQFFPAMQQLNIVYNLLYLFGTLCLIGATRGETAVWLSALFFALTYGFWLIYPELIAATLKHTKSPTRRQQLFYKVQNLAAYIILCISALTVATLSFFPKTPEPSNTPLPADIIARTQTTSLPTLVTITTNWSPISLTNAFAMAHLPSQNVTVITIPATGTAQAALPWLKAYNNLYAPLNILFTSRHPNGLKLPANLNKIDWQTSLETFDSPSNERTTEND